MAVDASLDAYEFSKACDALYHFTWDELCDWYLEIAKTQIPRDGVSEQGRNTQIVLGRVLDVVLRLLHPTMPFVTEVLWKALTGGESIVVAPWPTVADTNGGATKDEVAARRIEETIAELVEEDPALAGTSTTASVIRDAGRREPHRIPAPLARLLVRAGYAASGLSGDRLRAAVRRVELAWFGQDQDDTWAERHGLLPERHVGSVLRQAHQAAGVSRRGR